MKRAVLVGATVLLGCADLTDTEDAWETQQEIVLRCKSSDPVECMKECANAGISCPAAYPHPYKTRVGVGYLFACRDEPEDACAYLYGDGSACLIFQSSRYPLCEYGGTIR